MEESPIPSHPISHPICQNPIPIPNNLIGHLSRDVTQISKKGNLLPAKIGDFGFTICVTSRDNWPMGEMLHKYLGFGMGFGIWDGMGFGIGIWDGMGYGMGGEGMGGDGKGF
ncbi:hypothetical protein RhiirA5_370498 [Rhizophagus irregularis]|uniref:Uncharacterized protein n=1 Tax=Rhizophagus irregularis TaxID=588596 RepID=A0A2N0Q9D0_9GLOM|nr:hypothetical protein RhiirA5_370498 [Rhizophagus irregularis]